MDIPWNSYMCIHAYIDIMALSIAVCNECIFFSRYRYAGKIMKQSSNELCISAVFKMFNVTRRQNDRCLKVGNLESDSISKHHRTKIRKQETCPGLWKRSCYTRKMFIRVYP